MLLKMLRSKPGLGLGLVAGVVLVTGHPWLLALAFGLAFAAGLALALAGVYGVRLGKRVNRALPDSGRRPCANADCGRPIEPPSRARYCSETCREIAAERRVRLRVAAERAADYGEVPF